MKRLQYFTDAAVLYRLGRPLLVEFLTRFAHLIVNPYFLPNPAPDVDCYFEALANVIERGDIPEALSDALYQIETMVAPQNLHLLPPPPDPDPADPMPPLLAQAIRQWLLTTPLPGAPTSATPPANPAADSSSTHGPAESPPLSPAPASAAQDGEPSTAPPPSSIQHLASSIAPPSSSTIHHPSSVSTPHSALTAPRSDDAPRSDAPRSDAPHSALPNPHSTVLDVILQLLLRFVVLPKWVAETVSLFILHTYAWELRDVTSYLGIQSPQHRCGKSTLLTLISRLAQRPEVAAHISSPAVFRTIQKRKPTFIVDECEKVLRRNQMLTGILNASYMRDLAYVVRVVPRSKNKNGKPPTPEYIPLDAPRCDALRSDALRSDASRSDAPHASRSDAPHAPRSDAPHAPRSDAPSDSDEDVARYSCWCPKAMAQIGHFPETLADRCIIITMQRKTLAEKTERLRSLKREEADAIHRLCEDFVRQHRDAIANAQPAIPEGLNDRAADIWEPLFVLADLKGGDWPQKARQAALALSGVEQTTNVMGGLLIDCLLILTNLEIDRIFSRDLVQALNLLNGRPWRALTKGKPIDEYWLGRQLRPFAIHSQTVWVGKNSAKGYLKEGFLEPARRYVSKADWEAYQDAYLITDPPPELPGPPPAAPEPSKPPPAPPSTPPPTPAPNPPS